MEFSPLFLHFVSGMVLTISLQAAGELKGSTLDWLPFTYGIALATLYDAIIQQASFKAEEVKRSLRVVVTGSTRGI